MDQVIKLIDDHFCCIWLLFLLIILLKYICPIIKQDASYSHEKEMLEKKFEQEKWWKTQNDKDRDLKKFLDDRIEELKKEIESNAKSNLTEQEIFKAEHDFYEKILKDFTELKIKKQ